MPRILADLPDDDIQAIDAIALREGKSRAVVLREIIRWYIDKMKAGT